MRNFMVFDIGGSSVKWSVISEKGEILKKGKMEVAKNVDEFFNNLIKKTNENKEDYKLSGIAISAPGAVDSEVGIIGGASAIPYIHGPNFKNILKESTNLNVAIENDANCAALGEVWLGAAKENKDCAFVVCGSGIGGAIVKDKRVHVGINKHGGEFGYFILGYEDGKYLSWSSLASTMVLAKNIAKRKFLSYDKVNGLEAFKMYDNKDKIAIEEIEKYFRYMAIGIYNIQYTFDPEVIILGGAISEREDYIENINKKIDEIMRLNKDGKIRPIIKKCVYGNDSNMLGALYNFIR